MRRPILYSFLVEATVSAVLIATFKIAGDRWGAEAFGAWTLARRILSFALPLATIGIEASLARYIAYDPRTNAANYLLAATLVTGMGVGVMSLLFLVAPGALAGVLFGDPALRRFLPPLWALLVAYPLHILFFEYLRGHLRILEANALHLWAFGVAPLIGFYLGTASPEQAMSVIAALVAGPALVFLCSEFARRRPSFQQGRTLAGTLARFGKARMSASLALTALALLPPLMTARSSGLAAAGAVALGITLIGFAGTLMAPVALILMPTTARHAGLGNAAALQRSFAVFGALVIPGVVLTCVGVWIVAPFVGEMFLASQPGLARRVLRTAGTGAGCYAAFIVARAMLDATMANARVFHSTLIAGSVFALAWLAGRGLNVGEPAVLATACYASAMIALAVSAYFFARQALRVAASTAQ